MKRPNSGNRENCKLIDADGRLVCRLTYLDARSMARLGKCEHVRGGTYVLPAQASGSQETPTMLTRGDLDALIGITRMTVARRERLIGYGFAV